MICPKLRAVSLFYFRDSLTLFTPFSEDIAMAASSSIIGGHWVDVKSEEFDTVRFQIIASLHGSGIVDKLAIWKIEPADLNYKYEKKSSGMLKGEFCVFKRLML